MAAGPAETEKEPMSASRPVQKVDGQFAFGPDGRATVDMPDEQPPEVKAERASLLPDVPVPSEDEPL
jgi:hypothetical protein